MADNSVTCTNLEISVDYVHLVTVIDALQNLLHAVAATQFQETKQIKSLVYHIDYHRCIQQNSSLQLN